MTGADILLISTSYSARRFFKDRDLVCFVAVEVFTVGVYMLSDPSELILPLVPLLPLLELLLMLPSLPLLSDSLSGLESPSNDCGCISSDIRRTPAELASASYVFFVDLLPLLRLSIFSSTCAV